MRASFKDNIIVMIGVIIFILTVSALGYFAFVKPKSTGMITGAQLIKTDNTEQIEIYKKYQMSYALKVQDNNKFYLRYYSYENNAPIESKLEVTNKQYNKLVEDNKYWFMIKFTKSCDQSNGTIKDIFTQDPVQR